MNIIIPTNDFNINNVYFQEPIKNNIFDNSNFIKIIYSNNVLMLNCIVIEINFLLLNSEIFYNKNKYIYNVNINFDAILSLYEIEKNILGKLLYLNKKPVYRLYESLITGHIKIFHEKNDRVNNNNTNNNRVNIDTKLMQSFGLKISGVWENNIEYGVTYKFVKL